MRRCINQLHSRRSSAVHHRRRGRGLSHVVPRDLVHVVEFLSQSTEEMVSACVWGKGRSLLYTAAEGLNPPNGTE